MPDDILQSIRQVQQVDENGDPITSTNPGLIGGGVVSTLNTTTTPLATGTTYTGPGEQNSFPDVGVSCQTDQAGTLYFDFSVDGLNWTTFPTNGFQVAAGIHEFHTAVKLGRYFRPSLVNDGTDQSYLRLFTYYGQFRQANAPINQVIGADSDAIIVRSIDSQTDLAFGNFAGYSEDTKFGDVEGLDAIDGAADVWRLSDDDLSPLRVTTKTFPTGTVTFYLASSNTNDTMDVNLTYLDSDGYRQTAIKTLTGQTVVNTGLTGLDCNRLEIPLNHPSNAGHIYLTTADNFASGVPNDGSQILAYIAPGDKQTQQAMDQVPVGYKYRIKEIRIFCSRASGAAGSARVVLQVKKNGGGWTTKRPYPVTTGAPFDGLEAGLIFDALTQIKSRVVSVSDTDTIVTVQWIYELQQVLV